MKYTHMITITFLILLQSMFPLWTHAETVDSELRALNQEIEELSLAGESDRATLFAMKALEIAEKNYGLSHPGVASALNNLALLYYTQGEYAQAEAHLKRALAIREKVLEPDHSDLTSILNLLALSHGKQGENAQAEPLFKRAMVIMEDALGPDHPELAAILNLLAKIYVKQGEYVQAEPLYKRALAIMEKAHDPEHPNVAVSLNNLAEIYRAQGNYAKAEPIFKRALAIREKALKPNHPDVILSLNKLAFLYVDRGEYALAELLFKRALMITEKSLKPDHLFVAMSLNNLANLYRTQGDYAKAEPLLKRALMISESELGHDHLDVATSQNNLAMFYNAQGEYSQAEPLFKRALAIREKALGPDHSDVATSLNNLANLYRTQDDYAKAEPLLKRAQEIREKMLGPDHPDVAMSLNALALLYHKQGLYAQAELRYKRALTIREKALGLDHSNVANSLNNLAVLYKDQGKYAQAEPLYKRALAIWEKALGSEHPNVALSLNNLALHYYEQSRYEQAKPFYKRALAIMEKSLGPEHPDVAKSLNNLAVLYQDQGKYAQAKPHLKHALVIMENAYGPDHSEVAMSLNNLAELYQDEGLYAQAEPLYKRALAIWEKALGLDHPNVAKSLDNIARLHQTQGEYARAEPLYKRALAIKEKTLGKNHPDVASSLNKLASLNSDLGEYANAKQLYKRAMEIRNSSVQSNTQQTDIDNVFRSALKERCGTQKVNLLGFPDMYLNPSELAACEVAFIIDPDRYARQYEIRLVAHSLDKTKILDADLHEARNKIKNIFKKKHHKEPAVIDLVLSGDPISFYNLITQKIQLSEEQRISMEQLIGISMTEVLLGEFIEPDYRATDAELMHAVENTLFHAQNMSGFYLKVATENIHNALAETYANKTVTEKYLSMPVRLRKLLLSLASITTGSFNAEELAIMRAIQYSHLERVSYNKYWVKKTFDKTMQVYSEAEFIWLSHAVSEAQIGGIATWPTIAMLDILRALTQSKPQLLEKYAKYFPDIDYDEVLNIDTVSLRERYLDAINSHTLAGLTEYETSLLIADIRHVATSEYLDNNKNSDSYYIYNISLDNAFVIDLLRKDGNPLIELSWQTQLIEKWSHLSSDVDGLVGQVVSNIDTICEPYSIEMCDRLWRNIDLSALIMKNSYSTTGECNFSPSIELIFKHKLLAGHVDDKLANACSLDSLEIALGQNISDIISLLTQTSSRDNLLLNQSFVYGSGGLVAKHIYNAMGDRTMSLVPLDDYHMTLSSNEKSWAFFYEIVNNPVPAFQNDDPLSSIMYSQLATIYSMTGNHERSFLTQVNDLENKSGSPDFESSLLLLQLARLKHYARNSRMPESYIDNLMEKYIRENHRAFAGIEFGSLALKSNYRSQIDRNNYSNYENGLLEYILPGDLQSVFASLDDMGLDAIGSDKKFPVLIGRILSLSDTDRDMLCADEAFQKLAYPIKGSLDLSRLIDEYYLKLGSNFRNSFIDSILYFEYVTFDIRCRLAGFGLESKSYSDNQLISNFIILIADKVIPYIESGASFTDTRYSTVLAMFSDHSYVRSSTTGIIATIVALKHSFELMADAYIYRNSATLRLKMPDIETVIVNTAKALRDVHSDSEKKTAIYSRLMRRTESLAASAHAVFVSDRTRARMLDVENRTFTEVADDASIRSNTKAYKKMTEYFHKARNTLAASKTVSEAIVNKARFGEHGIQAMPRFYKAAAQIEKAIASPKEVFPTSNNSVLLNILSNGKQIYFQLLDDKGRYLSDTLDIQASLASRLKERITRNAQITDDDVKLGCEAFASVHQVLKPLIKDYSRLVVVPSVNLLPIPTELIIGTACDSSDATIIHTADVLGAIELMRSDQSIHFPQSFVGIGNPSLPMEPNQIQIAAVDGGNKEIVRNLSAIDEFKPLPDAEEEILEIAEIFSDTSIFTAAEGSIMKGLDVAQMNRQKGKDSAIVFATHGVGLDLGQGFELPSLLSVEGGRSTLIGATAVQQFDLDGSIVVLSACDTAAGLYEKPEMMFTGFVESFADAQSSFIVASLLPVLSQASKQHTVAFFRALKKGDIWQAARAGKKAVSNATDSLPFVSIYP